MSKRLTIKHRDYYFTAGESHLLVHEDISPTAAVPLDLCKWERGMKPTDEVDLYEAAAQWYERKDREPTVPTVPDVEMGDAMKRAIDNMHKSTNEVMDLLLGCAGKRRTLSLLRLDRRTPPEEIMQAAAEFRAAEAALNQSIENFYTAHDEWAAQL